MDQPLLSDGNLDRPARVEYYKEQEGCIASLTYGWIQPLLSHGNKSEIEQDNLEQLRLQEKSQAVYQIWVGIWRELRHSQKENPLWKSVWRAFKSAFIWAMFLDFLQSTFIMTTPLVVRFIISYLQGDQGDSKVWKGMLYLIIIVSVRFFRSFFYAHASFAFTQLGQNVSSALTLGIVDNSMRFSILCNKKFKIGELVNILQVDAMRLNTFPRHFSALIMLPYQIVYGVALMIWTIQYSFLGGFAVIIVATLINSFISKFTAKYQKEAMDGTDSRMKGTNELYNAIKFVKVNAWEEYFYDKLELRRDRQIQAMRRRFISDSFSTFSMWLTPKMILAVTFTMYTLTDHELDPVTSFTTQAIFAYMQFTLQNLPVSISQFIEGRLGLARIEKYLQAQEIDRSFITQNNYETVADKHSILLENGNFFWDRNDREEIDEEGRRLITSTQEALHLKDINLQIKKGEFVAFIGDVGSGKSSLMYALLGEMKYPKNLPRPQLKINGKMSLVTQKPWIINATVRENITFGKEFDLRKYEEIVHYACLKRDFELFTHGDQTMIGEKGATLSGGQKARISFARSLYSDSEVLLLDDLLSAVDVHVGKFLVKEALMKFAKDKTIILVTHALYYLKYVDKIYILESGAIVDSGDYDKIRATQRFQIIYANVTKGAEQEPKEDSDEDKSEEEHKGEEKAEEKEEEQVQRSRVSMAQTDYAHDISADKKVIENTKSEQVLNELMMSEDKAEGEIPWSIYYSYYQLNGGFLFGLMLLGSMSLWQGANITFNLWLAFWTEDRFDMTDGFYIGIYFLLGFLYGFFAFMRAISFAFSNTYLSRVIHREMQVNLLFSSLNEFFDRVPLGRILNRLSKDLNTVDSNFPISLSNFLSYSFFVMGNVIMCMLCASVWVIIPILFFFVACFFLMKYYKRPNRACVRLESITKSPIVSSFTEILNGLATIRAYQANNAFFGKSCFNCNENIRPSLARKAIEVWFMLRLTVLSFIVNIGALSFVIFQKELGINTASRAGLLLISVLGIDELSFMAIASLAQFQNDLISFERCQSFTRLEPEKGYQAYLNYRDTLKPEKERQRVIKSPNQWPDKGKIQFMNLYVKYRPNLDCVLRGLTVTFRPGEKVGVVGRTGSGKSTIMMTLLRILQAFSGHVLIDGEDISKKSLDDLRSRITIILQDPYMFAGNLRENLDPLREFSDAELNLALERCALKESMLERGGLNAEITENGENFSVGERQLISIARATLRTSKIVLIDEATANIDVRTESIIQQAMTNAFKGNTVITIAHRLNTVINSDRILVLEGGQVKEFDSPKVLLSNKNSFFAGLWFESQKQSKM